MSEPSIPHSELDESHRPRPHDGVASVELDGEVVLYDQRSGVVHVLNSTAAVIWSLLGSDATVAQIADELSAAYGADRDIVLRDVLSVIRELGRQALLDGVKGEMTDPAGDGHVAPDLPRPLGNPPDT